MRAAICEAIRPSNGSARELFRTLAPTCKMFRAAARSLAIACGRVRTGMRGQQRPTRAACRVSTLLRAAFHCAQMPYPPRRLAFLSVRLPCPPHRAAFRCERMPYRVRRAVLRMRIRCPLHQPARLCSQCRMGLKGFAKGRRCASPVSAAPSVTSKQVRHNQSRNHNDPCPAPDKVVMQHGLGRPAMERTASHKGANTIDRSGRTGCASATADAGPRRTKKQRLKFRRVRAGNARWCLRRFNHDGALPKKS
jgi:hypothetical protein